MSPYKRVCSLTAAKALAVPVVSFSAGGRNNRRSLGYVLVAK